MRGWEASRLALKFRLPQDCLGEVTRGVALARADRGDADRTPRIVVARGPAGYGKTTFLAQLGRSMREQGRGVAWITCDEDDTHLSRFILSLAQGFSDAGLISDQRAETDHELIAQLLSAPDGTCLILDDFEKAASPATERFLERLFERMPASFQMAIGTREPLGSWLLRREVAGDAVTIGAGLLRFSVDEIRGLFPGFDEAQMAQIEAATEGWPFAVQLAALRHRRGAGAADLFAAESEASDLFDYLSEQVLATLEPEQQQFLADVAVLPHINARSADALRETDNSAKILRSLRRLHPIVGVTLEEGPSLQIHPLFRRFLSLRADSEDIHRRRVLRRRAALHLEAEGDLAGAIQQALAIDDRRLVRELLDRAGDELILLTLGVQPVAAMLARIPQTVRSDAPALLLIDFLIASVSGRGREALRLAGELSDLWSSEAELSSGGRARASTLVELGLAFCFEPDPSALVANTLARLDSVESALWREPRARALILSYVTLLAVRAGDAETSKWALAEYQEICQGSGFASRHPSINPQRGLIAFLENDLGSARSYLEKAADLQLDDFGAPEPLLAQFCRIMLARTLYEQGEVDQAGALIEAVALVPDACLPDMAVNFYAVRLLTAARRGGLPDERAAVREAIESEHPLLAAIRPALEALVLETATIGTDAAFRPEELPLRDRIWSAPPFRTQFVERRARALVPWLLATGELRQARAELDVLAPDGLERPSRLGATLHLLRAELVAAEGADPASEIGAALMLAPGPQVFIDLLDRAADSLPAALARLRAPSATATVRRILQARSAPPLALAALTERERDIMVEAMGGGATKDIARALELSPETVKHHLRNIFGKLGVHSREEAVARVAAGDPPP